MGGPTPVQRYLADHSPLAKRNFSTVCLLSASGRTRQKPKMEILLTKSPQFDEIIAAEQAAAAAGEGHEEEEGGEEEGDAVDQGQ